MKIGDMQCPWHPGMTLFECQADHERVRDHARYTPEELDREHQPVIAATPEDVAEAEARYGKTIDELAKEAERGYQGASLYDTTGFDPSDLTYDKEPIDRIPWYDKEPVDWAKQFNKPLVWMGYPAKEVRCAQCQRYLPVTLPAGVTSMVIYCESCRHMKDTAHGG